MAKKLFPDGTEVVPFYVRAVRSGPLVFVSGTTSLDSKGRVQGKDAAEQTTITMRKIEAALKKAGCKLSDLTQMTIFVTDIRDMGAVIEGAGQGAQGLGRDLDAGGGERARRARPGGRDRKHGRGRELSAASRSGSQYWRRRIGDAIAAEQILERLDALGIAALLAVDAGAQPDHVGAARAFAAARAVSVEDGAELGAACRQLLVGRLRLGGDAAISTSSRAARANRIVEFSKAPSATTLYVPPCCEVLSCARSATGK